MEPMLYVKAISWIDDCRIPYVSQDDFYSCGWSQPRALKLVGKQQAQGGDQRWTTGMKNIGDFRNENQGRFPANLLVSDDMLNDGLISKSTGGIPNGKSVYGRNSFNKSKTINTQKEVGFGDKGSNSRYYDIDKWFENLLNSCG